MLSNRLHTTRRVISRYFEAAQALLGSGDQVLDLKLEYGERHLSVEGGSWQYGGLPVVKKQIWTLRLRSDYKDDRGRIHTGYYDWEMPFHLEATFGMRKLLSNIRDLKYGTSWFKGYEGHWDVDYTDFNKKFKGEKERKEMRGKLGMCLWKFETWDLDKLLDAYLLKILKVALIVDEKDQNYLALEIQDMKTVSKLNKEVGVAVEGKVETDQRMMDNLKHLVKGIIGISEGYPEIPAIYKPQVQQLSEAPKQIPEPAGARV